jgi:hypothetical protein
MSEDAGFASRAAERFAATTHAAAATNPEIAKPVH